MYKLIKDRITQQYTCIFRLFDSACIPFVADNTDYAKFKKAVMEGAELQDADGNVMTAEAAQEFVKGLA